MPLGEAIAEFVAEVFAQGFVDGLVGLVRRLGAAIRSLLIPGLTYRSALRGGWNRRVAMRVIAAVVLLSVLLA
jgi:sugar phosphate permease